MKAKKLTNSFTVKNNLLLDTHIFIWAMENSKDLSEDFKNKIRDPKSKVFVSVVTVWEIVIKRNLKKIKVSFNLKSSIKKAGFEVLPVQISHALGIEKLPPVHKDPFDRMLIA